MTDQQMLYEASESDGGFSLGNPGQGKTCVVCGDRALSCNFGAITCESCKAFFRRHAHKEIYGQCDGMCPVTVETRSYCRRCRLQKCFSVGMKKELILSEEQKQRRRQKILENRTKRQSQEVVSADSTSLQDMGYKPDMLPGDMVARLPPPWPGQPLPPPEMLMSMQAANMGLMPKRDIWESIGQNRTLDTEAKRHAFDAMQAMEQDIDVVPHGEENHVTSSQEELPGVSTLVPPKQMAPETAMTRLGGNMAPSQTSVGLEDAAMPPASFGYQSPTKTNFPHDDDDDDVDDETEEMSTAMPVADTAKKLKTEIPEDILKNLPKSIFEPCFFGLHPPCLDSKGFIGLNSDTQKSLLLAVDAYHEFCRPLISLHDKPTPQDYVSLLNRGEECYRQLVRFAKHLPEFRALSQDDQIALLKGNVIEIMIIRFSKCYDLKTNSWIFPHCGNIQNISGTIDDHEIFSGFCIKDYSNFVLAALECSHGDDLILITLKVITLFWPHVPNIENMTAVVAAHTKYKAALDCYLSIMYPEHPEMAVKLDTVMTKLRDVGKAAHDVMWKSQVEDLHPLLKEMFDLR